MNPKERLKEYLKNKGISVHSAEKQLGMSKGYIGNWKGNVRESLLMKIVQTFPDLNKAWLLTGEGEMLNQNMQIGDGTHSAGSQKKKMSRLRKKMSRLTD